LRRCLVAAGAPQSIDVSDEWRKGIKAATYEPAQPSRDLRDFYANLVPAASLCREIDENRKKITEFHTIAPTAAGGTKRGAFARGPARTTLRFS